MWNPKVSIIIPVYNGANYMCEAIDSALAQTYKNTEVIVVNDGSTDNGETERIALSYGDRIRYFRKENGGVSSALNYGIRQMTGDYFSWLSHDDGYTPEKIRHQVDALAQAGQPDAVALCAHYFVDGDSRRLNKTAPKRFEQNGTYTWKQALKELLTNGCFYGCSLLIPKEAFAKAGFFHEGLRYSQDVLMWNRIFLKQYPLVYNADEDVFARIHGKQLTQTGKALFHHDSQKIADLLIPELTQVSSKSEPYLYLFVKRNAVHGNRKVVQNGLKVGRDARCLTAAQMAELELLSLYGEIRPTVRKWYYKLFVKSR